MYLKKEYQICVLNILCYIIGMDSVHPILIQCFKSKLERSNTKNPMEGLYKCKTIFYHCIVHKN